MACQGAPAHPRGTQSAPVIATPVNMLDDGLRTPIAAMVAQMADAPGIGLAVS